MNIYELILFGFIPLYIFRKLKKVIINRKKSMEIQKDYREGLKLKNK